jgi:hypothetical protein
MNCPACLEPVRDGATRCPHCRQRIGIRWDGVAGAVAIVVLLAFCAKQPDNTANDILAAKRACDAQTGQSCTVP